MISHRCQPTTLTFLGFIEYISYLARIPEVAWAAGIARIFADALKALKVLPSGHLIEADRSKLVSGYVGQTAIQTNELIGLMRWFPCILKAMNMLSAFLTAECAPAQFEGLFRNRCLNIFVSRNLQGSSRFSLNFCMSVASHIFASSSAEYSFRWKIYSNLLATEGFFDDVNRTYWHRQELSCWTFHS